jgi:hypothetical protein
VFEVSADCCQDFAEREESSATANDALIAFDGAAAPVAPKSTSSSAPVGKRKRGRPQTKSDAKKAEAAQLKAAGGTNRQAAALIYETQYPTTQQVKNVPSILRHFHKKSTQSGSSVKPRKVTPKPSKIRG